MRALKVKIGTYGGIAPFGARFFAVVLRKGEALRLSYITSLSLYDNPEEVPVSEIEYKSKVDTTQQIPNPPNQIETGTSLAFAVKELAASATTGIYQITAREDATPDYTRRAVYWLAIDRQPHGDLVLGIIKVASNGGSYAGCARYATEGSAAGITMQNGQTIRALIDVEPSHISSEVREGFDPPDTENGENPEDQCPYTIHVEWNHEAWVKDEPSRNCGSHFRPRRIKVSNDGTISTEPAKVANPDE